MALLRLASACDDPPSAFGLGGASTLIRCLYTCVRTHDGCHNYLGHNYTGHNYTGHNYTDEQMATVRHWPISVQCEWLLCLLCLLCQLYSLCLLCTVRLLQPTAPYCTLRSLLCLVCPTGPYCTPWCRMCPTGTSCMPRMSVYSRTIACEKGHNYNAKGHNYISHGYNAEGP